MPVRCAPDDPHRCQSTIQGGTAQCYNKAEQGSNYCSMHGGAGHVDKFRNYHFARFKDKILEKADSPVLKELHEEVGLLRFVLESIINKCENEVDLMIQSGPITDLVIKIEKLVVSCNTLDSKLGNTMDKAQLLKFAGIIIEIISNNVEDSEIVELIADQIVEKLGDSSTFEVE